MSEKKCPPFCNQDTCIKKHHELIVRLVNIDERDEKSFDRFKTALGEFRSSILPEHPIPDTFREYRYPVLHWASVLGKINAVKFLVKNGYHPTIRSQEKGETALHRVVLCSYISLRNSQQKEVIDKFKTLTGLLAPALFIKDDNGNTPSHNCAILCNQRHDSVLASLHRKALEIMIDKIIEMKNTEIANEDGLNIRNREKKTVLHLLAAGESEDLIPLIRKLLDNGADPEMRDFDGKSPMDIAKEKLNRQLYRELKQKRIKRQRCESNSSFCGMPVEKELKLVPEHNIVTSTTPKDTSDESKSDFSRNNDQLRKKRLHKPSYEVRPSLVSENTSGKSKTEITNTDVSPGPSSSTYPSCQGKKEKKTSDSHDKNISGSTQKGFSFDEEKPTLEELLKNVNMGKFILDTVEEKKQELEAICLKNDMELQDLTQERDEAQHYHDKILSKIEDKMAELQKLKEDQRAIEDVLKTLDEKCQKQKEKRSEILKMLENYTKIVRHMCSVEQDD